MNRLVTPLKPLEAMAMERVLLTSNLPALKEMVKTNVSGDVFEVENFYDLSEKILKYLNNSHLREQLGKRAREYVVKNYEWNLIGNKYALIYNNILKN